MASSYTPNINLEKPTPGEQSGEWGTTLNTNFDTIDTKLAIKDEDNMASDSASHLATQQSIKAYVDSQVATDESIEDAVGGMVTGNTETGIAVTYEDSDGTLDFVVSDTTVAGDSGSTGITPGDTLTIAGGTNVTTAMSGDTLTVTSTDTNTQLTQEQVEDFVGGMVTGNTETGITVTYQDADGTLDFEVSGASALAADDLTEGDAAVTLSTSSGNITIDATANDADVIIKVDDAGAAVTAVTFDGSDEGNAIFVNDIKLDSDNSVIHFGDDQDVTLSHVHNSGLTLSAGANSTALNLTSTDAGSGVGPTINLIRDSANPAASDSLGYLNFVGDDDEGNQTNYAQIIAVITDPEHTGPSEDGKLSFYTVTGGSNTLSLELTGSTATLGGNIVIPDGGTIGSASDTDAIAIRSDGNVGLRNAGNASISLQVTGSGSDTVIYGAGGGHGLYGAAGTSVGYVGVLGFAYDTANYGYLGYGSYGIFGTSVYCIGALYAASSNAAVKAFRIPHGLREGYDLIHSSIEGPQYDLIYRGKVELVNGQASIDIDSHYDMTQGTFEWLTKSDSVQTFTSNETGWDAVRSSFSGDTITIECQNSSSTDTISWMVIAERGDPSVVEGEGTDDEGNLIIERESEPPPPPPPDFEPPPEE